MPKPEPTSNDHPVPFRTCIRLEDVRQTRTSSIDAEWDALVVAPTQENTLPRVSARPRFETLPGLGPVSQPALASTAQRSRRWPLLVAALAAALSISLALLVPFAWRNGFEIFASPTQPVVVHSNVNEIASAACPSPISVAPQPLAGALFSTAVVSAPASKAEPPPARPARKNKPVLRSMQPAARVAVEPRLASVSSFRMREGVLAATDNPY